jgi:carbon monoxide dehydrogenase subunit G
MKIENDFNVPADPGDTYGLLVDLERVGTCIPGGEVGALTEDGSHPVKIAVKLGPMRMTYGGSARIDERDDDSRRAVLSTEVKEQRGQGSAHATMTMTVEAGDAGSRVTTVTDVKLTGRVAQMGRGVVDDVAARLVADMAECIAGRLAPEDPSQEVSGQTEIAPAKPIGGFRLALRVLWGRIKSLFKKLFRRRER